jgi:hypothetical protein
MFCRAGSGRSIKAKKFVGGPANKQNGNAEQKATRGRVWIDTDAGRSIQIRQLEVPRANARSELVNWDCRCASRRAQVVKRVSCALSPATLIEHGRSYQMRAAWIVLFTPFEGGHSA